MRYVLIALIVFIAYRFIFNFLIPVIITTRQVRKGFREMHEKMQQAGSASPDPRQPRPETRTQTEGEYIDYEEIK